VSAMINPAEHPADEPCGGLCGAPACMEKALGGMGTTYSNGASMPLTAADVKADLERMHRDLAPIRAELNRIERDLWAAIEVAAAKQRVTWDEAARRLVAMVPAEHGDTCREAIDAARAWGERTKPVRPATEKT
jgi:hypothetical protein